MGREQNLKPFKKGQSGNPNGRPVRLFSEIAAEWKARGIERATAERVIETFEYLLALPIDELREMAKGTGNGNAVPSLLQMASEEMTGKRKREILSDMLDRAHGKATQRTEISGGISLDSIHSAPISAEQVDEIERILANGRSDKNSVPAVPGK